MPSSYRDLDVWKRSKALVLRTYQLTGGFPRHEVFGIVAQMRSAALSVPANIAEGQGRMGGTEFIRFLRISLGSLAELETYFDIARALAYVSADESDELLREAEEITRMLHGLIASIRRSQSGS
ncbi:four helix bundle protein [bacterium]|nr:four helix bundle protein [bacterium]